MAIDNLFGIPAHPLLVHLPLMLVPLAALSALVAVAVQRHRRRLAWLATGITFIALVSAQLAVASGQALERRVKKTALSRRHASLGDDVRLYVLLLFVVLLVLAMLPHSSWSGTRAQRRRAAVALTSVVVVLVAVVNVTLVLMVAQSGAKAVWNETPAELPESER